MATSAALDAARAALAAGEWSSAHAGFRESLAAECSADALDGLGRALWWLKEPEAALDLRTKAYAAFRQEGRVDEAIRTAVWLSREYLSLFRNEAVANGWLARARTLAQGSDRGCPGWVLLAESEGLTSAGDALDRATRALDRARVDGDPDLEIAALARCGVLEVTVGDVAAGTAHLDEAMASATAGEARDPQYVGEAFCALIDVANLLGDMHAVNQWASVLAEFHGRYDYTPLAVHGSTTTARVLSSYCGSCCGAVYLVTGRLDEAEHELAATVKELEGAGLFSRCVHPVTQLAELRIAKGRLADAERLLARYEEIPECTRPLVAVDLALGHPDAAASRLRSGLERMHDKPLPSLPLWCQMVDAQLARGDVAEAAAAAGEVARIAELTGSRLHRAETLLARGKVAAARGETAALSLLREATRSFGDMGMPLAACRARLAYARAAAETDRGLAVAEASASQRALERLGATLDADEAAALLRKLGVKGRTGPKHVGTLSQREQEVLVLLSHGLSNAEIAQRLFISTKTAGHHVSNILSKLGLRSRTEAAAYAVVNPPNGTRK